MAIYISLLRGINVSGKNLLKMDVLCALYKQLGFTDVQHYLQSGNVVFSSKMTDTTALELLISQSIHKAFGYDVPVIVIELPALKKIISGNPLTEKKTNSIEFLHVTFLEHPVNITDKDTLHSKLMDDESIAVTPQAIYLYCPSGYGKTKLNNNFIEKTLKVRATTRNWKTTNELYNIAISINK